MLVPYKYTYFLGTLILFIPWAILYWHRKDLRKEMWFMGIAIAIGMGISQYYWWTKDWWRPETITGTIVGIEDILLGFSNGGIAAVLYEELFGKHVYRKHHSRHTIGIILISFFLILVIGILFWYFKLTSFAASTIGMIAFGVVLMVLRKDLLLASLFNAILMVLVVLPIYYLAMVLSPGYIETHWLHATLSGIRFTGIPIEELVFYSLFGFIVAPYYEYWQGIRLRAAPHLRKRRRRAS